MTTINSLKDRVKSYQELSDFKLMKGLPLILVINGRNFSKVSSLINKPFSIDFTSCLAATMLKLIQEVDGSVMGYCFNDEIIIVSHSENYNAQFWYDGRIQKISSAVSSVGTLEFSKQAKEKNLELLGDPIFLSHVFSLPNIQETINLLISKQNQCFNSAVNSAAYHELSKKYSHVVARDTLNDKTTTEKIEILNEECNIEFESYSLPFRNGVATFRRESLIDGSEQTRKKIVLDVDLPRFSKNQNYLRNIFNSIKIQ
jgi:tRNA(His) 5'-end guanylyltransferase